MKKTTSNYNKISNQIQCVIREIRMRERCYPSMVARGKIDQTVADYELNSIKPFARPNAPTWIKPGTTNKFSDGMLTPTNS